MRSAVVASLLFAAACGGGTTRPAAAPAPAPAPATVAPPAADATSSPAAPTPFLPPAAAFRAGLMPLRSTGVTDFQARHPTYDGRGVLIGILDSGIDAGTYGLITTTTGAPKLLDLRDFSGEGAVALVPVSPGDDGSVAVAGRTLGGARRVARLATGGRWFGGVFRELPLGPLPASDVNGNGTNTDEFPLVVVRATDGWVVFLDSNLNGSLEDEMPLHDYRQGRETIALGRRPLTLAANFREAGGEPQLDLYFDTSGHGTFVAGVAAGHNLFNVPGFHGVAPGAQLIGLKIANNARGGVSVTGSFVRAMEYAARFASERGLPLVLNLSFGVGNEREGAATIDSLVDAFLAAHPQVVFTIAAGNDGPGLSTLGFPGSADRALSVGSTFPGSFARPDASGTAATPDVLGWWSSRGGEVAKPDLVAPGVAFSSVPRWDTGNEVKVGTSFSAPHVAGLVANLVSGLQQENRPANADDLAQALRSAAVRLPGGSVLDQGAGVPRLEAAWRWLVAGHQGSSYVVRAAAGAPAAVRREGFQGPGDTVEVFSVRHAGGLRAGRFLMRADVPWLDAADTVIAQPGVTPIPVRHRADSLRVPGVYVGTVVARNLNDTLSGALFRLVSTVIVPFDLSVRPLADPARRIAAGRVQRWFLRAPAAGGTLDISVTLPDSIEGSASVALFEPSGQPVPGVAEGIDLGDGAGTARLVVRGEDLRAGVYELTVVAPPLSETTVGVQAAFSPVVLAAVATGVEISNPSPSGVTLRVSQRVVGATRAWRMSGRGSGAESLSVRVPSWASGMEVDVTVAPEVWPALTDLAVTVWDSAGQQVTQDPQNYARGRRAVPIDSAKHGRPLTVELFPAWARPGANPEWSALVTVRFLLTTPLGTGSPEEVRVVAGGRVRVARAAALAPVGPEGFVPLLEIEAAPTGSPGAAAVARVEAGS